MAKGKAFTIQPPQQPSKPRILTSTEAEAILTTPTSPANPVSTTLGSANHVKEEPTNMTHIQHPSTSSGLTPSAAPIPTKLPSDAEVAKLMPNIPAEFRNQEIIRKRAFYYSEAAKLGATAAKGELTLIALAEKAVDGAIEGALLVSDECVHALEMYNHFNMARAKAKPQTEDTVKNKARQLNWFIRLGAHYQHQAKQFFNDMVDLHNQLAQNPQTLKSLKYTAVYEDVNNLVRKQMMKVDDASTGSAPNLSVPLMDEEEARTHMFKSTPEPNTAMDFLIAAFKALEKANDGKKGNEKKSIADIPGFKANELREAMQIMQDFANNLAAEERKQFMTETAHKKPGKKKAAPPTAAPPASPTALPAAEEQYSEEAPQEFEGYLYDADTGHYVDETGMHYTYNAEAEVMEEVA